MTVESLHPVRKRVTVSVAPERAFDAFTSQMGKWWNPDHHLGDAPLVDIVLEPREGGGWFEVDAAGTECRWGRVLVWEPPSRLVLNWQLDAQWTYSPEQVTELTVTFTALSGEETLVELEHSGLDRLGEGAAEARSSLDGPGGWAGLLARFGEAV